MNIIRRVTGYLKISQSIITKVAFITAKTVIIVMVVHKIINNHILTVQDSVIMKDNRVITQDLNEDITGPEITIISQEVLIDKGIRNVMSENRVIHMLKRQLITVFQV